MKYVVMCEDTGEFLAYDNKPGPMSSGYPYGTTIPGDAHQFSSRDAAQKALEDKYFQEAEVGLDDWYIAAVRYDRDECPK